MHLFSRFHWSADIQLPTNQTHPAHRKTKSMAKIHEPVCTGYGWLLPPPLHNYLESYNDI